LWTYFLLNRVSGRVKVGRSTDVRARVQDLQAAGGCKLTLLFTLNGDFEREWHLRLRRYRKYGEWFQLPAKLVERVAGAQPRDRLHVLMGRKMLTPPRAHRSVGFGNLIRNIIAERRS
jgi:hypothetical protein